MTTLVNESTGEVQHPPIEHVLEDLSLEALWSRRELNDVGIKALRDEQGKIDMELRNRFAENHPDYTEETGGSVQLAGADLVLSMTYDREYAYEDDKIIELQALGLLTDAEYKRLVPRSELKVDGNVFRDLQKRGGELAARLKAARYLKSARPKIDPKARK